MVNVTIASALSILAITFMVLEYRQQLHDSRLMRWTSQLLWLGGLGLVWALAYRGRLTTYLLGLPTVVFALNLIKIYGLRQKAKGSS